MGAEYSSLVLGAVILKEELGPRPLFLVMKMSPHLEQTMMYLLCPYVYMPIPHRLGGRVQVVLRTCENEAQHGGGYSGP